MVQIISKYDTPLIDPQYIEATLCTMLLGDISRLHILEIGCGDGKQANILSKDAMEYTAVDINEKIVSVAKKQIPLNQTNVHYYVLDASTLPFPDNRFDVVLMFYSLHEIAIEKQELVLQEVYRLLKAGGKLLIIDSVIPSSDLQKNFDLVHEYISKMNHFEGIKNARFSIKNSINNGLFKLEKKSHLDMMYKFSSKQEIINYLIEEFQYEIIWTTEKKLKLQSLVEQKYSAILDNQEIICQDLSDVYLLSSQK